MVRIKANCNDDCGNCEKKIIATAITNSVNPIWDLTPYQGAGIGDPHTCWRVWERSGDIEYHRGKIDENGTLVGLPDKFESEYFYDGYMELQQGCSQPCCVEYEWGSNCLDNVSWP